MLESDSRLKVIGYAENGSEAVQKAARLRPDVITMDIEMPLMDGITATRKIMAAQRVPILMFSSLTTEGARSTLDALDAGAVDFLPKRFEEISRNKAEAAQKLIERVLSVANQSIAQKRSAMSSSAAPPASTAATSTKASPSSRDVRSSEKFSVSKFKLVAIGTSTGGPVALQKVLLPLPANYPLPILLIQHMPGSFTGAFAQRLDSMCNISVREAEDGDELKPGLALLAPGGKQMLLVRRGTNFVVNIQESDANQSYKPSVDLTYQSIARCGIGKTLAVILTGMGSDGCQGAKALSQLGSQVWAQSEKSCVVAGMPSAVISEGIADKIYDLEDMGRKLSQG
jgi:two-component system chemotaxis response regulator CheB